VLGHIATPAIACADMGPEDQTDLNKAPDTPDHRAKRAQDCRAKAAYCKWVASISPDKVLRRVDWEKEAAK
jgi:hypothetical protein